MSIKTILQLIKLWIFLPILFNCAFLQRSAKTEPIKFDYVTISKNYFSEANEKPFPLTVQRGNNLYNTTTSDGRYLFYTTDNKGNYDIWLRDLTSSIIVPITEHPAPEYKPAISPDGKKLVFVSEQYDSEGDIVLLEMNPEKWVKEYLKGNRFINQDFKILTNPDYSKPIKEKRFADTDPAWSPDNHHIVFSSERFTPGLLNLVIMNIDTGEMKPITKDGGSSPFWSYDGKSIVYISYKEEKRFGEIYRIDLDTGKEDRLTQNEFLEFSPSLSPNGVFLFYTSIQKDTNKNGILDQRDFSFVIRQDLTNGKNRNITSGTFSLFDTKYSNFGCDKELYNKIPDPVQKLKYSMNCGSILFSASLFNTINVYFIPVYGPIPEEKSIEQQFSKALRYKKQQSTDGFWLALDSVELFFENDPSVSIFKPKVSLEKVKIYEESGYKDKSKVLLDQMLKESTEGSFAYPLAIVHKAKSNKRINPVIELEDYYSSLKEKPNVNKKILPAILELLGDQVAPEDPDEAIVHYNKILKEYPDYYNNKDIKRKIADLEFDYEDESLPEYYIELINDSNTSIGTISQVQKDIQYTINSDRNYSEKLEHVEKLIKTSASKSKRISNLLHFLKAEAMYECKCGRYEESNNTINSYIADYESKPVIDPYRPQESLADRRFEFNDPLYLKSLWLRAKNYEKLGKLQGGGAGDGFFNQLRFFLVNYSAEYEVDVEEAEIEKSFRKFENAAREKENIFYNNKLKIMNEENLTISQKKKEVERYIFTVLRNSAFDYFYNTENIFLLKSKNLYINTLYDKYSIYYYKKLVDSVFTYGRELTDIERTQLLNQLNKNLLGASTSVISNVLDNPITGKLSFLGDFKDLKVEEVLGKDSTQLAKYHFNEAIPRARSYLYLAALYGYSYYLINKAVSYEEFYNLTDTMTQSRKENILNELKQAEYELKWIIFANPQFSEAYLLLGWLYQYIDLSKTKKDSPDKPTYSEMYSAYEKYFPGRHIEENIDLYHQILDYLGDSNNKKLLSDLNLNLGNTYLLLNNYSKAKNHYDVVENYEKFIVENSRFENYKQRAIFYYNYAKTLLYLGESKKAAIYFEKVADIYLDQEYYSSFSVNKDEKKKETSNPSQDVSTKMILINSIKGLAEMEAGECEPAIRSFRRALALNISQIGKINLYNALAICYQKTEKYSSSDSFVTQAKKEAANTKYNFNRDLLWDFILPQNKRIIGEGRFPDGFPPKFQNLLAQSIEIKNNEEQLEYSKAEELIRSRDQYIKDNYLDITDTGKEILNISKSKIAYNQYAQGNYLGSYKTYIEAYEKYSSNDANNRSHKILESAHYSLFAGIESNLIYTDVAIESLQKNLQILSKELNHEILDCAKTIDPEIKEIPENLKQKCKSEFLKIWKQYDVLVGLNYYYLGDLWNSISEPETSYYYYGLALEYLKNPGNISLEVIGLPDDIFNKYERAKLFLNQANIYWKLNDKEKYEESISFAEELINETENIELRAKVDLLKIKNLLKSSKNKSNYLLTFKMMSNIDSLITKSYNAIHQLDSNFFIQFYELFTMLSYKANQLEQPFINQKKLSNILLFKNLVINRFVFKDKKTQSLFQEILKSQSQYNDLDKQILKNISEKKSIQSLLQSKKTIDNQLKDTIQSIQKYRPELEPFFNFENSFNWKKWIKKNEVLFSAQIIGNTIVYELINSQKKILHSEKINTNLYTTIVDILNKESKFLLSNQKIIIVPSPETILIDYGSIKINNMLLSELMEIHYAFKESHLKNFNIENSKFETLVFQPKNPITIEGKEKYTYPLDKTTLPYYLYDSDIIDSSIYYGGINYFNETKEDFLNIKEIFSNKVDVSAIVINNAELDKTKFYRTIGAIDIFRASGVNGIVLIPNAITEQTTPSRKDTIKNLMDYKLSRNVQGAYKVGFTNLKVENYSKQRFQQLLDLALKSETKLDFKTAIKYYYSITALQGIDSNLLLDVDIHIAKLKTKLYYNNKDFYHFRQLFNEYTKDDERAKILFTNVNLCYYNYLNEKCNEITNELNKLKKSKEIPEEFRKKITSSISFYRSIEKGKLTNLEKRHSNLNEYSSFEENFEDQYGLSTFLYRNFIIDKSVFHAQKAVKLSRSPEEKQLALDVLEQNQILKTFLKVKGEELVTEFQAESPYSSGIKKDWMTFDKILNSMDDRSINSLDGFRKKMFRLWKKIETNEDYNPLSLLPEKTSDGKSIYYILNPLDKTLLFYLITRSVAHQTKKEINNIFDLLLEVEGQSSNKTISYFMILNYASELYSHGDTESAIKYITLFEKEHLKNVNKTDMAEYYYLLKYKLSLENKTISFTVEENSILEKDTEWHPYLKEIPNIAPANLLSYLNDVIKRKKNLPLNLTNRRELNDFIYLLQSKTESKENIEYFLDLTFAKDKIASINERTLGREPLFNDIPTVTPIIGKIKKQIPENQSFIIVTSYKLKTHLFKVSKNEDFFSETLFQKNPYIADSRGFKKLILDYHRVVKEKGNNLLQKEFLETMFKNEIYKKNEEWSKVNYLYLSSFYFKIPLELKAGEHFYLVRSPELLVSRPVHDLDKDFQTNFSINRFYKSNNKDLWLKKLRYLEDIEVPNKVGNPNNSCSISSEELDIYNLNSIQFGGKPIHSLDSMGNRKGPWMIAYSNLYKTHIQSNDMFDSLLFLDKIHTGPGVISLGSQLDVHNIKMLQKLYERKETVLSLKERYLDGLNEVKKQFPLESNWNGYRLYTNTFVKVK